MKTNKASIVFSIAALLCIISIPAIEFAGGLLCFPLAVPPLFPAQIIPYGIWLFVVVRLFYLIDRATKNKRHVLMPWGALMIAFASMGLFFLCYKPMSGFVWGLKTRFAHGSGYEAMREFAEEVSQRPEGIIFDNTKANPWDQLDKQRRAELTAHYPFLGWGFGMGRVYFSDGVVHLCWGSALAGYWGFRVSPNGPLRDLEDCSRVLRVSDDIQFVFYE